MIFKDRVKENSTSTGTGNFTLAGAEATFSTFNTAYGVGVPFCYTILDQQNGAWEVGVGQLSAATTLVRTTVQAGSNGASPVNFAVGSKSVFSSANGVFLTNAALIDENNIFTGAQRGSVTTLTYGATVTPDMNANNFFTLTLTGNATLANPTNEVAGQSGSIFLVQDATGSRTLAYGSDWDFAGGTVPSLTTTANAVDRLDYLVRVSGSIHANLVKDVK